MNNVTFYYNGDLLYSLGGNTNPQRVYKPQRKHYAIDNMIRRCIISAAKKMADNKDAELILLTGTFPFEPAEREASKIWTNFISNLKKTYKLNSYVWTKERQDNGRIHYHLLCDIKFNSIKDMQQTYNICITNVCPGVTVSNNSLRLPDRSKWGGVINNSEAVASYIAKYVSKSSNNINTWYFRRCYQISQGLFPLKVDLDYIEFIDILRNNKNIVKKYRTDYASAYFIRPKKK